MIGGKQKEEDANFWISYADLMAGLLFVFILLVGAVVSKTIIIKQQLDETERKLMIVTEQLKKKELELEKVTIALKETQDELKKTEELLIEKETLLAQKEALLAEKERLLAEKQREIEEKSRTIQEQEQKINTLTVELEEIKQINVQQKRTIEMQVKNIDYLKKARDNKDKENQELIESVDSLEEQKAEIFNEMIHRIVP